MLPLVSSLLTRRVYHSPDNFLKNEELCPEGAISLVYRHLEKVKNLSAKLISLVDDIIHAAPRPFRGKKKI